MGTLAGWAYRKAITVNHTDDGAQTNYQMKLTINHGDGEDSTGVVYLNHHALNWPTDIQITASDGTTAVDFWREESDATDGTWWIECPSIADGSTWTGYIYYGDADATDESDGASTFLFFDHFDGDLSLWTGDTDHCAIASSIVTLTANGASNHRIYSTYSTTNNIRARFLALAQNADYSGVGVADSAAPDTEYSMLFHNSAVPTTHSHWLNRTAAGSEEQYTAVTFGSYQLFDFIRCVSGTDTIRFYYNDNVLTDKTTRVTTTALHATLIAYGTAYVKVDWVAMMNTTLTEPTWAASGAEEALGTVIKSVPRLARMMVMSP